MKIIAKTLYGLEDILASELSELGAEKIKTGNRAVSFEGTRLMLYRANYLCRTALSFLVPVAEYHISAPQDLYNGAITVEWERYLNADMTYAVTAVVSSQLFTHSGYPALVVKDAVADFFRRLTGKRPSVDSRSPDILINLHISHNKVTISLDSTVIPLYKRGYREEQTEAPLNEVLAAGIIKMSGWKGDVPLVDGMCGSGTIPAEAGLMACNIAPGHFRRFFGFMKWVDFDEPLFRSVKYDAQKKVKKPQVRIFASDISAEAARIASSNINGAGLNNCVTVGVSDFISSEPPCENGMIIINPPYGQRIGDDISSLYRNIGSTFKHQYQGFTAWVLSGEKAGLQAMGLKPFRKYDLLNGNIECRLQGYRLFSGSRRDNVIHKH